MEEIKQSTTSHVNVEINNRLNFLESENSFLKKAVKDLTDLVDGLTERLATLERSGDTIPYLATGSGCYQTSSESEEQLTIDGCPEPSSTDPGFITYLLSPHLCDWYFVVGNTSLGEPERIGVVKKMLLAHSVVLQTDLIDHKADVHLSDTFPDTFKHLLRFVYGHDNTSSLSFDEADNLLYIAEKYLVEPLKARLSARLMELVTPHNVCALLNNPACRRDLALNATITKILQYETTRVLESALFLDLCVDGLVMLVEQEALSVPEIEVWRAAVRWAKHRAGSERKELVRKELEGPAKHIRLCTIDKASLCDNVFRTGLLTGDEVAMVCEAWSTGQRQDSLVSFCNEIEYRRQTEPPSAQQIRFKKHKLTRVYDECILRISTDRYPLELLTLDCEACWGSQSKNSHKFEGRITIVSPCHPPAVIDFKYDKDGDKFSIPLVSAGKNIILQPYYDYTFLVTFLDFVTMYYSDKAACYRSNYIEVTPWAFDGDYYLPTKALRYRPLAAND